MIETSGGKVFHGGQVDRADLFVELTIILDPKHDSQLMTEEIFGPIIPVIPFRTIEDAI
jgi:aldehyde dehydrogenase (NAD+)